MCADDSTISHVGVSYKHGAIHDGIACLRPPVSSFTRAA